MPQKRNPVALEHARAIASKALGEASAVTLSVHNTPFGDIVDTEDDLQPLVAAMFRDAIRAVTLVDASMRTAEFDVERMAASAGEGGISLTELADCLVRAHGLPFATAHAIARRLLTTQENAGPLGAALAEITGELLGTRLEYSDAELAEIMSPRHFVDVRETLGGPAPAETARAIVDAEAAVDRDKTWLVDVTDALAAAESRLRERSAAL